MTEEKKDKKACCCKEGLCKLKKFKYVFPHNWFKLNVLYYIFVVLFYIVVIYGLVQTYDVFVRTAIGYEPIEARWPAIFAIASNFGLVALALITFATITKALKKIKCAVKGACKEKEEKHSKK
ncbi:hypothetical protein Emin_0425 [Elusimicrobium minutum Pei191]|uniref:Uncharacterized protein n=1 Tax=Elusimicrobium minutum (strain Pei191) TaxID=445932 RepID=B2KBG0_ELUMP|nr:hypothetical protein [Elusimicrobium minutum]ACC97982.1 hypothetical protein Emin_0425 [Elusimicrobium minutum Pei191]